MLAKYLFSSVPGSIILASIIISTTILISGGNINIKAPAVAQKGGTAQAPVAQAAQGPAANAPAQADPSKPVKVPITASPILGDKSAKITIVEFSDFECPFCKKAYDDVVQSLKKDYITSGKVRLVYKNLPLPFHQNAAKEAEAALCAKDQGGDASFFKYHDQIFTKTTSGGTGISLDQLPTIATDIGLDGDKFKKCLAGGNFKADVDKDLKDAQQAGASGTPTWFIGKTVGEDTLEGTPIVGALPYSTFKDAIDKLLSQI